MRILAFLKNKFSSGEKGKDELYFARIIEAAYNEWKVKGNDYWSFRPHDNSVFNNRVLRLTPKQKVAFIIDSVFQIAGYNKGRTSWHSHDRGWQLQNIRDNFLQHLLKTKLVLDDTDIEVIVTAFASYNRHGNNDHIICWPVNLLINQVDKQLRGQPASDRLRETLELLRDRVSRPTNDREQAKILGKIENLLFQTAKEAEAVKPVFFPGDDEFSRHANERIRQLDESDKIRWFRIMLLSQKAAGVKPSKKFLEESRMLFKEIGTDRFKHMMNDWFSFLIAMEEKTEQIVQRHNKQEYSFKTTGFLSAVNTDMIKGFVWMCVHFHDKHLLSNIATLAERSYRKISGRGPAAAAIGNACLFVLANVKGMDGAGYLSKLRLRIKQSTTQNLIEKYLHEAAAERGVSINEIEDMAVDDYGLETGRKEYHLHDYKAVLKITGVGKTEINWFKPDGTLQKSEPAAVKQNQPVKLKKIRDTSKQVELMVSAQRDRLDRMFKSGRSIEWSRFMECYFSHGLMSYLADLLIWNFERDGEKETAFFLEGKWVDHQNEELAFMPDEDTIVSLWHPLFCQADEIKNWRDFMLEHKIVQPLKQAFREVYRLSEAETGTITSSKRMAGHILKQHQFDSAAKARGWKYSLLSAYNEGRSNEIATIELPDHGLRAEFWVNEVSTGNAINDTGIWLYVATDQLRFIHIESGMIVELREVPPIVLSEVMRDLELFVGVASIANDPAWQDEDGIVPVLRDYWHSYSFGELTEIAKTRRAILEKLVPDLKITPPAELGDQFLLIKGKLRTYKIHIGSTHVLIEPGGRFLCMASDRSLKEATGAVFLPFDGDTGLSVLLNKAMLLADDDKITDPAILQQINYV